MQTGDNIFYFGERGNLLLCYRDVSVLAFAGNAPCATLENFKTHENAPEGDFNRDRILKLFYAS